MDIITIIKHSPLLSVDDTESIGRIAEIFEGEVPAGELAVKMAAQSLQSYRSALREIESAEIASNLPVRKSIEAGNGGGRYYWRVRIAAIGANPEETISAVKYPEKTKGDLQCARRAAREAYCKGLTPLELIPPDYDPQAEREKEHTVNRSKFQPAGLAVHQREKKH